MKELALVAIGFVFGLLASVYLIRAGKENNPVEHGFCVTKIQIVDDKNSLFYINPKQEDVFGPSTIVVKAPHSRYNMNQYLILQ